MKVSVLLNRMSFPFMGILLGHCIGEGDVFRIVLAAIATSLVFGSFVASRFEG